MKQKNIYTVVTKSQIKAFEQGAFELTMRMVITGSEKKAFEWLITKS